METVLKATLGYNTCKSYGGGAGGCISDGQRYRTDQGDIFVKVNNKSETRRMFDGEYASLEAIYATGAIRCPTPVKVLDLDKGAALVMEYMNMTSLSSESARMGEQLANMHLHNSNVKEHINAEASSVHRDHNTQFVDKFGFDVTTCCGYLPEDNTWHSDWTVFYARRLEEQITRAEQNYGDREAVQLWGSLQRRIGDFFKGLDIVPALLHGDLWSGNVAQNSNGPVIFDPASFYGHHEFDLGIASMFGGFSRTFWSSYHNIVVKDTGWDKRNELYQLFHYLNHWNHFGSGYRGSSISLMKSLSR